MSHLLCIPTVQHLVPLKITSELFVAASRDQRSGLKVEEMLALSSPGSCVSAPAAFVSKNGDPEESRKLDRQSPGSPLAVSHAPPASQVCY